MPQIVAPGSPLVLLVDEREKWLQKDQMASFCTPKRDQYSRLFLLPAAGHFSPFPSERLHRRADKNGAVELDCLGSRPSSTGLVFPLCPFSFPLNQVYYFYPGRGLS